MAASIPVAIAEEGIGPLWVRAALKVGAEIEQRKRLPVCDRCQSLNRTSIGIGIVTRYDNKGS